MKKFLKTFLILAVVLIVAGFSLALIAKITVGGQSMSEAVDEITDGRVSLGLEELEEWGVTLKDNWDLEITQEGGFFDIDDASVFDRDREIWEGEVERVQIAQGEVRSLSLEAAGSLFELEESPDGAYYLEARNAGRVQAYEEDGTLYVKSVRPAKIASEIRSSEITLYVPADAAYEEVKISFGAGELEMDGLRAGKVTLSVGAGVVSAERLTADSLAASLGAGELKLEEMRLGELDLEIGAGSCEMEGTLTGSAKAECGMGSLELDLEARETDYNYQVQCVAGHVTVGAGTYTGLNSARTIDNGADRKMELICAMGNIQVGFDGSDGLHYEEYDDRYDDDRHDDDHDDDSYEYRHDDDHDEDHWGEHSAES